MTKKLVLRDARALLGAAAMMIVGALLSSMILLHFNDDFGLARARWWWEIMMNLQALSCAFVWFCYVDRLRDSEGRSRPVMRVRMWSALVLTLTPAWVTVYAASRNWFVVRPELSDLNPIFVLVTLAWVVSVLIPRAMYLSRQEQSFSLWKLVKPHRSFWMSLVLVLAIVGIVTQTLDVKSAYIVSPFLLFFVTSVGYLKAGISFVQANAAANQKK